ncbi:lactonase family protein [Streptomyces sp. PU-14G]|uniref:lactonase family protein n=1 Tax=Streptomyces sp. PU-14G TaxID=2800808 RepID=UPI0034DE7B91
MAESTQRRAQAYIGSFTSAGGRGITTAALDIATGALTPLHHTEDAVTDPSFLALAPSGGTLYAVSESDQGGAAAFALHRQEPLELLGSTVSVHAAGPTHLSVADGRLHTANYTSGSVTALPLRADGSLEPRPVTHQHHGSGPVADRQEGPHAHAAVPDPSGQWLLVTDLGTDSVWIYDLRGPRPGLHLHREVPLRAGTGPRHLAFAPGARERTAESPEVEWVYVVNELDSTVTTCRWRSNTGELEPLGETRVLPSGHTGPANYPSALVLSPDGRFAWVANRGDDSIAVLDLSAGELPVLTATVPCGGHWPRDLAAPPAGGRLYAANERSGDVTWFDVDHETGMPHRGGSLPAPAASCVVFDVPLD